MSCPDWCGCSCHVPEISGLISLWIYGVLFTLFLGSVFIRFMRAKADYWYLEKALLRIDPDDKMHDDMIQMMEERGDQEKVDEYRRIKVERAEHRERTKGKIPLWLRGFYSPRANHD